MMHDIEETITCSTCRSKIRITVNFDSAVESELIESASAGYSDLETAYKPELPMTDFFRPFYPVYAEDRTARGWTDGRVALFDTLPGCFKRDDPPWALRHKGPGPVLTDDNCRIPGPEWEVKALTVQGLRVDLVSSESDGVAVHLARPIVDLAYALYGQPRFFYDRNTASDWPRMHIVDRNGMLVLVMMCSTMKIME